MKYALTHNGSVFLGPMDWNPRMFKSVIEDDYEIHVDLPVANKTESQLILTPEITVWPCKQYIEPPLNKKIQFHNGPFYEFISDFCVVFFEVQNKQIDLIKGELKSVVALNRWKAEIGGVKATVQGKDISLDTQRGARDIFLQAYQLGSNGAEWKFPEGWLTLSNAELGFLVQVIMGHVQTCFTWESNKVAEIEACTSVLELDVIVLEKI